MRVHFVNSGPAFPYSYYLGVMSAVQAFGDKVKLWLAERPSGPYFDLLEGKVEIEPYPYDIPDFPMLQSRDPRFKRVAIFDHCAWRIVAEQGGTIMGLDSFTVRPFLDLLEPGKEALVGIDAPNDPLSFCGHGATFKKSSKMAKEIYENSLAALYGRNPPGKHRAILENGALRFGASGIIPFLNCVVNNLDRVSVAEFGLLSGFHHRQDLHPDCRTIPHYATSRPEFVKSITEENIEQDRNQIAQVVKETLPKKVWRPKVKTRKRKLRFHLLGLVHLPVSERYMGCAFTQKIVKLSKMLLSLGHEVILYGAEGSDAPCTEFVQTHTLKDIREAWGEGDNRFEIGYDWETKGFRHDFNAERSAATLKFHANSIAEINKRKRDDDFLLLTMGRYQKPVDDEVKLFLTCEPGIGYRGSYSRFRAFESAYLQNFTYGSEHPRQCINGAYYDRVIPNYFDAKDFKFCTNKEDYFFFIGRLIKRKGIVTAHLVAQHLGKKLKIAGQGMKSWDGKTLKGEDFKISGDHLEYIGYVDPEQRNELMGKAKAVFVPTLYMEAFGGVNVEAQLCGTPVITTDFSVFPETVKQGVTGFRCSTLQDFVEAAKKVDQLDPKVIRQHAERYLMKNVKHEFDKWFHDLYQVYLSAKEPSVKGWHHLE